MGRVSKDSNEIPRFRFMGMLDLAGGSTKEEEEERMQAAQAGCIHFAWVIRPSCARNANEKERERDPRLLRRGYCTLGTSYPPHQLPEILARAFSERIPVRGAPSSLHKERFHSCEITLHGDLNLTMRRVFINVCVLVNKLLDEHSQQLTLFNFSIS